jgi:hypothetical protein
MDNIAYYKDIILYKGIFYTQKENLKSVNLHNRIDNPYIPSDISQLDINLEDVDEYDKGILLLEGFHSGMGHLLWDCMYPSYYGLFCHKEEESDNDFQWMALDHMYKQWSSGWHLDVVEKFSGNKITTPIMLSAMHNKPLKIPYLIVGIGNIGIGNIGIDFCASRQLKEHINDPIESFVNRMYLRYKIKRNTFINKQITDLPINIIYIINKRPYNNIDSLFNKLSKHYSNKCIFSIIDWSAYNFEQQLNILNRTGIIICGVGMARTNTPLLPNGSIEIQTNTHSLRLPNNINYFDYHIGTLSKYIKVNNINEYTLEESRYNLYSHKLEKLIDDSINMFANIKYPINVCDNIPQYILDLVNKVDENKFKIWRNSLSNSIEDLFLSDFLKSPLH